ncbi:MAG TPA: hemolysin family protein, partial [Ktedonobacterales bacterium]
MATRGHSFSGYDWALIIGLFVALLVAAASAAAETALTSISHIRMRNLAEEGDVKAQRIRRILEHPDAFLSTILVVSNISVITASTLATIIAVDVDFSFAEVISTVLLSIIVLIFCEITPKTAAVQNPERMARFLLRPLEFVSALLKYVVVALTGITNALLRLFGVDARHRGPFMTEDELRLMVEVGEEEGVLEEDEREMIHNVFDLGDTSAREVMVPRIDMVTVEADDALENATQVIMQGGFSRIPVYDDSINDIIGVLYAKDLLRVLASGQAPQTIRQLPLRSAYFVPESKRLDDLLHEMRKQRVHMAIVVDEYGAVAGLVTIEDVVEEIIGDIKDEYDKEEQIFERVSDNEFLVDAKI